MEMPVWHPPYWWPRNTNTSPASSAQVPLQGYKDALEAQNLVDRENLPWKTYVLWNCRRSFTLSFQIPAFTYLSPFPRFPKFLIEVYFHFINAKWVCSTHVRWHIANLWTLKTNIIFMGWHYTLHFGVSKKVTERHAFNVKDTINPFCHTTHIFDRRLFI